MLIIAAVAIKYPALFNISDIKINKNRTEKSSYPSEEEVAAQMALIKIRSHEIACIYRLLRRLQEKASEKKTQSPGTGISRVVVASLWIFTTSLFSLQALK